VGLISSALGPTRAIVRQLLRDRSLREMVTYRRWKEQSFDAALGHNVEEYDDFENLKALRLQANERALKAGLMAELNAGDVIFMTDFQESPTGLSNQDLIVDAAGAVFKITEINHIFGVVYAFKVEGPI
jgi:hypothetical protein